MSFLVTKKIGIFKVGKSKERKDYLSSNRTLMMLIMMIVTIFGAITTFRWYGYQLTLTTNFINAMLRGKCYCSHFTDKRS